MSIRKKILATILVVVLITAGVATFVGRAVATDALEDQAKDHVLALTEAKTRAIENLLEYQRQSVQSLAGQFSAYLGMLQDGTILFDFGAEDDDILSTVMRSLTDSNSYVWQALYLNQDGLVEASSFTPALQSNANAGGIVLDDWSQVDYSELDWAAVDAAQLDWSKVDYSQVDWYQIDLSRVDWSLVDLSRIDLSRIDISGIDLSHIDWSLIDISQIDYGAAELNAVDWSTIDLGRAKWSRSDMRDLDIYLKGREGPYVGNLPMYQGSNDFVLAVSAPFYAGDQLAGVMVYLGGEDELCAIAADRSGLGDTGEVYLVNEEGFMLTPSRFVDDAVLKQVVPMSDMPSHGEGMEAFAHTSYMGNEVIGTHCPIPGTPWTVVVEKSRSEVLQPVSDLTRTMLWMMFGLLALGGVLGAFFSSKMSSSILKLRHGAELITQGDWTVNVATDSRDEIGQLSRSISAMTANLQQSHSELQRYSSGLEDRLAERDVLLKEIHHRVKNNLQIISSLLNLQKHGITDEPSRSAFEESGRRVQSMALIHEQLYQSGDLAKIEFKKYLRNLADNLVRTYATGSREIAINIEAEDVSLSIDTAVPCGLMVNELITNSMKYAFPESWQESHSSDYTPEINVGLAMSDDQILTLVVADNGIGLPEDLEIDRTETLGLQLVTSLASQLSASVEVERTEGTTFRIRIPQSDPSA